MNDKPAYTILFVDDDSFLTDMYSLKFTTAGHTIRVAHSAKEALSILHSGFTPDAVVLDLIMPELSGFDLLEAIQKEGLAPHAARIVLSNQGEQADLERARALGCVGNIIKSNAIPSEVLALVVGYIQRSQR